MYALAVLPVVDAIVNQVPALQEAGGGPLSAFQFFRGVVLVGVVGLTLAYIGKVPRQRSFTVVGYAFCVACLVVFTVKEFVYTNMIPLASIVAYLQVLYWLSAWLLVAAVADSPRKCRIILTGLVIGAALAAGSVALGYWMGFGASEVYAAKGVVSSQGGFHSAKATQGFLLCGGLAALALGTGWRRWLAALAASGCMAAAFLVYARAGMVAAAVALTWLVVWYVRVRFRWRRRDVSWVIGLVFVLALMSVVYLKTVGTEQLRTRWSDVLEPGRMPGSGRFLFWQAACNWFRDTDVLSKFLGTGFVGMHDAVERYAGMRRHTHSDFFDMLCIGGLLGLTFFGVVVRALARMAWRTRHTSSGFAVAFGVLLIYLVQGLLTGQLFFPSTMYAYVVAISCAVGLEVGGSRSLVPPPRGRPVGATGSRDPGVLDGRSRGPRRKTPQRRR